MSHTHAPQGSFRLVVVSTRVMGPRIPGLNHLPGLYVAFGLALLVTQLEDDVRVLDGIVHPVGLLLLPGHGLLHVDMLPGRRGVDAHLGMPVVRGGDEDGVHLVAFQHVRVPEEPLGRGRGLLGGGTHLVRGRVQPPLGPDVEDVTDGGEIDVQVVLLHEGGEPPVPGVPLRRLPLVLHPFRVCEAGAPHQGLSLPSISDDPDAGSGLPGGREMALGMTAGAPSLMPNSAMMASRLAFGLELLLIPAHEEDPQDRNGCQAFQDIPSGLGSPGNGFWAFPALPGGSRVRPSGSFLISSLMMQPPGNALGGQTRSGGFSVPLPEEQAIEPDPVGGGEPQNHQKGRQLDEDLVHDQVATLRRHGVLESREGGRRQVVEGQHDDPGKGRGSAEDPHQQGQSDEEEAPLVQVVHQRQGPGVVGQIR